MFRGAKEGHEASHPPAERITSVLGQGIAWKGALSGSGGLRIEGTFEGDIDVRGLVIVAASGRVECEHLKADSLLVEGSVKGKITADRVEITSSGRIWGDVVTKALSTAEGAFLRGSITMQEEGAREDEGSEAAEPEA